MKTIIKILMILLLMSVPSIAPAQIAALEKYADAKNVTYVYISKTMLRMAAKHGEAKAGDIKLNQMIDKLSSVQVVTSLTAKTGQSLAKDIISVVDKGKYPLLMSADNNGQHTRVYFRESSGKAKASVIILVQQLGITTVVGLEGTFNEDDLAGLLD